MKILMVSSYLPYPLKSGGEIRLYNLMKNLAEKHEITLICEKRDYQTKEDVEEVKKICKKVITVTRRKQWTTANILKTGLSMNPFLIVGHTSEEMKLAIKDELVRERYDLIHVETFYVYQNLPKVSIPVILVEHNVEYLAYQRYIKLANPFLKLFFTIDVMKLKKKEEQAWRKVDKLVAVSNMERRLMKRADISVVPNGVDLNNFQFRSSQNLPEEKRILFIGDFKWFQNVDAAEVILKQIWPRIGLKLAESKNRADIKLWIIGRNIPEKIKSLAASKNIILEENSKEETAEIFRKAYLLLAPIRAGGGTSYKILEAFASGVGVVTTNLGLEGLEAKNNIHALASEKEDELAELSLVMIQDHSVYRKLTLNARKLVEEKYDWRVIAQKLDEVYMSCF
ncbi:MAG TPA: glycosyltransferase family 4 protein [Patescibacteria group bacterium]|jgi:glycosyltransferase involved in cell wall biosynthesis|nr:glycosyltransferase family 4 protein [Patescibacteria group bacterium]